MFRRSLSFPITNMILTYLKWAIGTIIFPFFKRHHDFSMQVDLDALSILFLLDVDEDFNISAFDNFYPYFSYYDDLNVSASLQELTLFWFYTRLPLNRARVFICLVLTYAKIPCELPVYNCVYCFLIYLYYYKKRRYHVSPLSTTPSLPFELV